MSRKKKKYIDTTACNGTNTNFGTVYDYICMSVQYQALSLGAKQFYTLCRVQSKSKHGTSCLYNHGKEEGTVYSDRDFVFPAAHLRRYGVDRGNATRYFKQLIDAGFIDRKEENKHRKKVNVYSFSSRWQYKESTVADNTSAENSVSNETTTDKAVSDENNIDADNKDESNGATKMSASDAIPKIPSIDNSS